MKIRILLLQAIIIAFSATHVSAAGKGTLVPRGRAIYRDRVVERIVYVQAPKGLPEVKLPDIPKYKVSPLEYATLVVLSLEEGMTAKVVRGHDKQIKRITIVKNDDTLFEGSRFSGRIEIDENLTKVEVDFDKWQKYFDDKIFLVVIK